MSTLVALTILAFAASTAQASPYLHPHIINGRDARVGEFPHQGSLQVLGRKLAVETFEGHVCGCVLVANKWVTTAAHCVGDGPSGLYVVLGLHRRGDTSIGAPVGYYIKQIYSHPGWEGTTGGTDAAMIELQQEVEMNEYVKPIAMADEGDKFEETACMISGWGVTREGFLPGPIPEVLQAAMVPVMRLSDCQDIITAAAEGHICVGGIGVSSSCNGDSGGPLTCGDKLAGVTSFGIAGCWTAFPSVYQGIPAVRSWIKEVSGL